MFCRQDYFIERKKDYMLYNSTYKRIYSDRSLSACDLLTLLLIHRLCGNRDYLFTTVTHLTEETDYNISSISRSLKNLEKERYISRHGEVIRVRETECSTTEDEKEDEGSINLSTRFFDVILDKDNDFLKQQSNAVRISLKLYHIFNVKLNRAYVGKIGRKSFLKSFSKDYNCSEKTVKRVLNKLIDNKLVRLVSENLSPIILKIFSTNLLESEKRFYGKNKNNKRDRNYYRDIFLIKGCIDCSNISEKDLVNVSELITQYRDKFKDGEKDIIHIVKKFVKDNGYLIPSAIHNIIKDRINNPALVYNI